MSGVLNYGQHRAECGCVFMIGEHRDRPWRALDASLREDPEAIVGDEDDVRLNDRRLGQDDVEGGECAGGHAAVSVRSSRRASSC